LVHIYVRQTRVAIGKEGGREGGSEG
jgi:hypothetical protein